MSFWLTADLQRQAATQQQFVAEALSAFYRDNICFDIEFAPTTLGHALSGVVVVETITFWGDLPNNLYDLAVTSDVIVLLRATHHVLLVGPFTYFRLNL